MKATLLILVLALPCWAQQDPRLQDVDREIPGKERDLAALKAEQAKLAADAATPEAKAMWADPRYATTRIGLVRLEQEKAKLTVQIATNNSKIVQLIRSPGRRVSPNATMADPGPEFRPLYAERDKLHAQSQENLGKIVGCMKELKKLRREYKVPDDPARKVELDREIPVKEKELVTLRAERTRLAGKPASFEEKAMWADPEFVTKRAELMRLQQERDTLDERATANRRNAATPHSVSQTKPLEDEGKQLAARIGENVAMAEACKQDLQKLRQKYKVRDEPGTK
jgi:hypothetical protein